MKALNILTGIISLIACVDTAYGGYGNSYGNNHGNNYGSNYGNGNYGNTQGGGDRVKFTDIKALTFRAGKMSTSRRVAPVPQMKCISGPCQQYPIRTIQCRNVGDDGFEVNWECKAANLDADVAFETGDVVCEGYDRSGDAYVLRGSCGVEYSLRVTGNSRNSGYGGSYGGDSYGGGQQFYDHTYSYGKSSGGGMSIMGFIFLIGAGFVLYQFCFNNQNRRHNGGGGGNQPRWGGGPGGGGVYDHRHH